MAYTPVNWEDSPKTTTAIDQRNLNHMDMQIAQNASDLSGFQTQINSVNLANERIETDILALNDGVNGLKFVVCSRADWEALAVKPTNTVYIFNG